MLDEQQLSKATNEISEILNLASLGREQWSLLPDMISQLFPGTFVGLQNIDVVNSTLPFVEFVGVETSDVKTYAEYYHLINPYERHWQAHKNGQIWISDEVLPVTELTNDEFYNDWMSKIGDYDSAIGVRLDATVENEVRLNIQYPTRFFNSYTASALELFKRLKTPLTQAIENTRFLDEKQAQLINTSTLLQRVGKAACIIDQNANLYELNDIFEGLLEKADLFAYQNNKIRLSDYRFTYQFESNIRNLALYASASAPSMHIDGAIDSWVVSFTRLPQANSNGLMLHRPYILIVATPLRQRLSNKDIHEFAQLFLLTTSEGRLCQALDRGASLSEAATECGVTYETARSRIKSIFQKTQTTKQSELLILMERYQSS